MQTHKKTRDWVRLLGLALAPVLGVAQQTPAPTPAPATSPAPAEEEEVIELSPFEVNSSADTGYTASETLAGTRVRTRLEDLATPLSVVTAKFLSDTGATNNQTLLQYTTSTEVGGTRGNFSGLNGGGNETGSLLRPNNSTRVRGLAAADNTRNFFLSDIPWDSYNIDRVEIQRGPNSILFGLGSPAGIINNNTNVANLSKNSGKVEGTFDNYASVRFNLDYNQVLIKNLLALRVDALRANSRYRQQQAYNNDRRVYLSGTFTPQILSKDWASPLTIRANIEAGDIKARNPRILPPEDHLSNWFAANNSDGKSGVWGLNKALVEPYLISSTTGYGYVANGAVLNDGFVYLPGITSLDSGSVYNGGLAAVYNNGSSTPESLGIRNVRTSPGAIGTNGVVDRSSIGGLGSPQPLRSSGYSQYARDINAIDEANGVASRFPAATQGVYADRSLTDSSVFDFYNNLIDGNNGQTFNKWNSHSISVSQSVFDNRLAVEGVYDKQRFRSGRNGFYIDMPFLAVDINLASTTELPQYYRDPGTNKIDPSLNTGLTSGARPLYPSGNLNSHAGSVLVSGSNTFSNYENAVDRESKRFTLTGELRGSDIAGRDSWLAKAIGVHHFTGLVNQDITETQSLAWTYAATDQAWNSSGVKNLARQVSPIVYLSSSVVNSTGNSPAGLHLNPINSTISPHGTYSIGYFDSTWNHPLDPSAAGYVNPAAPYTDPSGNPSTQNENPANYVGWTNKLGRILNADYGDRASLTTEDSRTRQIVNTRGITWQADLIGGLLVPTYGWREDKLRFSNAQSDVNPATDIASGSLPFVERNNTKATTRSWGIVAKMPSKLAQKIPGHTRINAFYNRGNNQQVATRYTFNGDLLPNPSGKSTDYGIVISTLDDRLTIKVNHFESFNNNQTAPVDFVNSFGGLRFLLGAVQTQGLAQATRDFYALNGAEDLSSFGGWSHAYFDGGANDPTAGSPGSPTTDPNSDAFKSNPSTIAEAAAYKAYIASADPKYHSAIGQQVDVVALQKAVAANDIAGAVAAWGGRFAPKDGKGIPDVDAPNLFSINGAPMVATLNSVSKGWEVEINAKPTPNWDVQWNLSKTDSYNLEVGPELEKYVAEQYARFSGPAGQIRLYFGGLIGTTDPTKSINTPIGTYTQLVLPNLKAQRAAVGLQAPELRPWQSTLISNYTIKEGVLKNVNFGGAIRYASSAILGYRLLPDASRLDPNSPLKDSAQTGVDLWVGYERKLSDKLKWRVQLNVRDVGKKADLIPVKLNPDGTAAYQRIRDGMGWAVTNSLMF